MRHRRAGYRLQRNAERHLKAPPRWRGFTRAIRMPFAHGGGCRPAAVSLDELAYEYPDEPYAPFACAGHSRPSHHRGAEAALPARRAGEGRAARVAHELALIEKLGYARYFLTVYEIVRFARSRGILCQGRGSAANFRRLLLPRHYLGRIPPRSTCCSSASSQPSATSRPTSTSISSTSGAKKVIQYIYDKYGRERAGIVATVITYRSKSAIREVGQGARPLGGCGRRAVGHDGWHRETRGTSARRGSTPVTARCGWRSGSRASCEAFRAISASISVAS